MVIFDSYVKLPEGILCIQRVGVCLKSKDTPQWKGQFDEENEAFNHGIWGTLTSRQLVGVYHVQ